MPGLQKDLYVAPSWDALKKMVEKGELDKHPEKKLKSTANTLYKNALMSKREGDEEKFYLYCMRYCTIVGHIGKKFGKSAAQELLKPYQEIVKYAEELSDKLPKRYELMLRKDALVANPAPPKIAQPSAVRQPVSAAAQPILAGSQPGGEKGHVVNGNSGYQFINPEQLFEWLYPNHGASGVQKSVLIIDVRSTKDYESSHIKSERSISCPEEIIEKGKAASYYGSRIHPQFKALWDQRKFMDHLVLMDWSSTSPDIQENGPLEIFKEVLDKWDPGHYHSCPHILDGGFEMWNTLYPNSSTCSRVQAPSKELADSLDINDISFPNLSESPKDWSIHLAGIGNGGEPSPYDSISRDNRYAPFSSKPPLIDRSSKANAEQLYEKNKLDQRQLEKDIDKSKTVLDDLSHKLITNQTKELLEEKRKWEEKCNELARQHQSKEEENDCLRREIEELRQRERVAAARQAPKPGVSPVTVFNERTQLPDVQIPKPEEITEKSSARKVGKDAVPDDDLSAVSPKQDLDAGMLRSHSSPNIAQIPPQEWHKPPTYDRSTKPVQQSYGYGSTHRIYDRNRGSLTGLKNLGNTCYMNSIIQCISNTSKLAEYFCYEQYVNDLNVRGSNPTGGEVARKLASVIQELWSGDYRYTGCEDLKRTVGRHVETFAGTSQQDSHEFLTFLMDWLHKDLCRSPRQKLVKQELLSTPNMAWAEYKKAGDSFISELFFVQQVSTVVCRKCNEKSVTYEEPTSNLTLHLPAANNRCTLQDCLRLYTTGELISGYRCEACEHTNDAIKKVDIWRLPQILVIHLKRFYSDGFYHKRQTLVDFPLKDLEMKDFTSNTETTNTKYDLYAVSNHYGTLEGGHYTAFCRNKDKWYKFDDQDVTEIPPSYVRSSNAYILFYEQT